MSFTVLYRKEEGDAGGSWGQRAPWATTGLHLVLQAVEQGAVRGSHPQFPPQRIPLAPQFILTSSSSTYTRSVCYLMTAFPCTFKYLSGTCSLPTELLPQAQNSGSQEVFALCQGPNGQQLHCSPSTLWAKTRAVLQRIAPSRFVSVTQLLPQPSPLSNQRLFRYQLPRNGALNKSFTVIQSCLRCVSTKEMASQSTHTKPMPATHRLARRPQTKLSVSGQLLNLAKWGTGAETSSGDVPTEVSQL